MMLCPFVCPCEMLGGGGGGQSWLMIYILNVYDDGAIKILKKNAQFF